MIGRRSQRPSARELSPIAREPSPSWSALSDCDADDEGTMSSEDLISSRPLSVAIPQAPYCPRRPTLAEILSNTAPPPWTLSAFMAYLSQNHCLETLEFTMDATRYRKHFDQMRPRESSGSDGAEYVKMLWRRLLDAYIIPDGPREVNLPSDVRDRILALPMSFAPPSPDALEPAVKIIYDLMDESVLVPFLNSVSEYSAVTAPFGRNSDSDTDMQNSADESSAPRSRSRRSRRGSSPASTGDPMSATSSSPTRHHARPSRTSNLMTTGLGKGSRMSPHASNSSTASGDNLTDDSGSPSSPGREPMTPPTTPPTSDTGGMSPGMSPRSRNDTWKKMTGRLGFKKPSRGGLARDARLPGIDDDAGGIL